MQQIRKLDYYVAQDKGNNLVVQVGFLRIKILKLLFACKEMLRFAFKMPNLKRV